MNFISYAQNFEDVMLWRALRHISNGFYIDVGANDPVVDSVTKAFYDRGWSGINIEPLKTHYQDLMRDRPNDINLLCAAGSDYGQIDIWVCDVRGWGTASSKVIQKHERDGYSGVLQKVPLFPLATICEQYVNRDIHFLKIDVEGLEKDVLKGMNFKKFRPWIVVVEATKPNSTEEVHEAWEELIFSNNYIFVYADGLNRFYISKEKIDILVDAFRYPPNVFDRFISFQQYDFETKIQKAETEKHQVQEQAVQTVAKLLQAQAKVVQAEDKAKEAQERAIHAEVKSQQDQERAIKAETQAKQENLRAMQAEIRVQQSKAASDQYIAQLQSVYSSNSWRITAPLRWSVHQMRLLRSHGFKQRARAAAKKMFRKVVLWILEKPKLKSIAMQAAYKLGIAECLKPLVLSLLVPRQTAIHRPATYQVLSGVQALSPRAHHFYVYLKQTRENSQKGDE